MRDPELELQVDELCLLDTTRDPTEAETYDIYCWIDSLEFSKPKKNMARDFSDGVLMAEVVAYYIPQVVNTRNFYTALSKKNKVNNWNHLTSKVFSKLGFKVDKKLVDEVIDSKPGAIEKVLFDLRPIIARQNRSILNYRVDKRAASPRKPIFSATTPAVEAPKRKPEMVQKPPRPRTTATRLPRVATQIVSQPPRSAFPPQKQPADPIPPLARSRTKVAITPEEMRAQRRPKTRPRQQTPAPEKAVSSAPEKKSKTKMSPAVRAPSGIVATTPETLNNLESKPKVVIARGQSADIEALFAMSATDIVLVDEDSSHHWLPSSDAQETQDDNNNVTTNMKEGPTPWSKSSSSSYTLSPEELVLSGNASSHVNVDVDLKNMRKSTKGLGIPGTQLGLYGLV